MIRHARFRLRDASTVANPDGTTDVLVVSTKASDSAPYLDGWPEFAGASFDALTAETRDGEVTLSIVDPLVSGTSRLLTQLAADAQGRWQLLSRRCYVDLEEDLGGWAVAWAGYLLDLHLADTITWRLTLGESRRIEHTQKLFTTHSTEFPLRGALLGGPVLDMTGGSERFFTIADRGGWEFEVAGYDAGTGDVTLLYRAGYFAQGPWRTAGTSTAISADEFAVINERVRPYFDQRSYLEGGGTFPGLTAVIVGVGLRTPVAFNPFNGLLFVTTVTGTRCKVRWGASPPANGTRLRLHLVPATVSEEAPAFFTLHPVDLLSRACSAHGLPIDAVAVEAVRAEVGPTVRVSGRIGTPPVLADFVRDAVQAPFGIGLRRNTAGSLVPFLIRRRTTAAPAVQIGLEDLWDHATSVFSLAERSALARVRLSMPHYRLAVANPQADSPPDGVSATEVLYTPPANPDASTFSTAEHTYQLPVMVHTADAATGDATALTRAIAVECYDRFGRGAPRSVVRITHGRPAASATLGDRVLLAVPHAVNANKRLGDDGSVGARVVQVMRRTPALGYVELELEDVGTADQAVAPAAVAVVVGHGGDEVVCTIAASAADPRALALVTITNAAAINATGVLAVAVEWATGPSAPTTAGADSTRFLPGAVPTTAFPLPTVPAGTRVWARTRSEQNGRRPSSWSAWVDVTLSGLAAPTNLAARLAEGTAIATLEWAPATGTNRTEVFLAQSASAPADWTPHLLATLPAGAPASIDVTVSPGALPYQWRVRQLEADGTPGAAATGSFTSPVSTISEPTLQCTLTLTPTTGEIAYVAVGAVEVSIDGGAWTAAGASPIIVARSTAGGSLKAVTVRAVLDGRIVSDTLPVPPIGWIGDGQVGLPQLVPGLQPIEIVGALPTTGNYIGRVVLLTSDQKLYRWNGGAWTATVPTTDLAGTISQAQLADGAVNVAKFASGLQPVEIVGALPGSGNYVGRVVLLTTDQKLYRWTGGAWTATVPASDISGTLSTAQLADGAVNAAKLANSLTLGGANFVRDSDFRDGQWALYDNDAGTSGAALTYVTPGRFGSGRAARVTWSGTNSSTKGVMQTAMWRTPVRDQWYVLSWYARANNAATVGWTMGLAWNVTPQELAPLLSPLTALDTWQRWAIKFRWTAADPLAQFFITIVGDVAGGSLDISCVQFEAGEVPTAWGPTPDELLAGVVGTTQISDDAVTAPKILANAVVAGKIDASAVSTRELAALAVTADKLAANSVIAGKVQAGAISAAELAANAVTSEKLAVGRRYSFVTSDNVPCEELPGGWLRRVASSPAGDARYIAATGQQFDASGALIFSARARGATAWNNGFGIVMGYGAPFAISGTAGWLFWLSGGALIAYASTGSGSYAFVWSVAHGVLTDRDVELTVVWQNTVTAEAPARFRVYANGALLLSRIDAEITAAGYAAHGGAKGGYGGLLVQTTSIEFAVTEWGRGATVISDGAVTTRHVQAGTVVASHLAADAVQAGAIQAGAVVADKIAANAVTVGKIAAGAIRARELTVLPGLGTNLAPDQGFADDTAWVNRFSAQRAIRSALAAYPHGPRVFYAPTDGGNRDVYWLPNADPGRTFPVVSGRAFRVSARFYVSGPGPVLNYLSVASWDEAGATATIPNSGNWVYGTPISMSGPGWTTATVDVGPGTPNPWPAAARWWTFGALLNWTSVAGVECWVQDFKVEEILEGGNVRAASLTGDRIAAGSIAADRLAVTQLSAIAADLGTVNAGTINGGQINAGVITLTGTNRVSRRSHAQAAVPATYSPPPKWLGGYVYDDGDSTGGVLNAKLVLSLPVGAVIKSLTLAGRRVYPEQICQAQLLSHAIDGIGTVRATAERPLSGLFGKTTTSLDHTVLADHAYVVLLAVRNAGAGFDDGTYPAISWIEYEYEISTILLGLS